MATLTVRWTDVEGLRRFDNALKALGGYEMRKVANRAINRAGDMAKTQVIRALTKQTGLPRKTIVEAIKVKRSAHGGPDGGIGGLEYRMTTRGANVSLKYFGARETRQGVSAAPFGQRQIFPETFIKGGRFPKRVPLNMGGHVFKRIALVRLPIEKQTSDVAIPREMLKGETARVFQSTVASVLPRRLAHEINRATGGVFT